MTVADRIRFLREQFGWSQEEMANKLGLKSRSSVTRIEKSGNDITLKDVERISEVFGCSPLYLMGWENGNQKEDQEREKHFVALYSCLDEKQQKLVDSMLETLASK